MGEDLKENLKEDKPDGANDSGKLKEKAQTAVAKVKENIPHTPPAPVVASLGAA